jgi:hypothetical protein
MFQVLHTMKLAATYTYGEYAMQVCVPRCLGALPAARAPAHSTILPACAGGPLAAARCPLRRPVCLPQGSWSDDDSLGPGPMAAFDGQGSGDDFYGVCPLPQAPEAVSNRPPGHLASLVSPCLPGSLPLGARLL